ncbi:MAG: CSLREA domain-containing protein [Rubrobacteraceae bacterium]
MTLLAKLSASLLALVLVTLVLVLFASPAQAGTLTVTSTGDSGDGSCTASSCTLRDAVDSAASGDTIEFESDMAGGTISLTKQSGAVASALVIDKDLTIRGFSDPVTLKRLV